jgi:hypothetical protein
MSPGVHKPQYDLECGACANMARATIPSLKYMLACATRRLSASNIAHDVPIVS